MVTHVSVPDRPVQVNSVPDSENIRQERISVLDLLIVLAERKRMILAITAIVTGLAIAVSFLLPKKYTANSTILPPQQSSSMGTLMASQLGNAGGMAALAGSSIGLKNPNDMYVAMLRSRTVEEAMVQRYGLMQEYHVERMSQARKQFENVTKVDGTGKDGLIRISVTDRDSNRASELANGYVDQFRQFTERLAITEAGQRRLFFQRQLLEAKENLANAEEALKRTQQKTGLIELNGQARALIESATVLRAQVAAKDVEIQALQTFATDQNAQLIQAQKELETLRSQLARLGGSEDGNDLSFLVPKGKVPDAELEYLRKMRDVKYNETIFEILARQFETAKLDEAKQGAVIQVVDTAVPPDFRSSPQRTLIVLGAMLAGIFSSAIAAALMAGLERLQYDLETRSKLDALRRALRFRRQTS